MKHHSRFYTHTTLLIVVSLLCAPLVTPSFFASRTNSAGQFAINLDCSTDNGTIVPYAELNSGPLPIHYVKGNDITGQYKEVGIDFIRTHDFYGPTDISTIFPDWNADPEKEESYNFTSSDYYITGIVNAGCCIFYRLGESASDNETLRQPPQNFSKWAEICKHVVMHYNDGWDSGYNYNITYWEIWNEPDLDGFWNGTAEQYYELYKAAVQILKEYNESLKIGGPCTSSVGNANYTTGFLDYITENELPLDFFSWHMYADSPDELYMASRTVRKMLDDYGLADCENINTEWNINILSPQRDNDNAKNAAFTACVLTAFQDAGIDHAFRYRGTQDNNLLMKLLGFDLSIFAYDGTYKTPALTYLAMHYLVRDGPIRLSTPPMNTSDGISYLAGISGDKTNVSVLISNYDAPDVSYTLNIANLPWNECTAVYYLIDDSHHLEITENETLSSSNCSITTTIESNTVQFIRLTNSTSLPDEGPEVASIPFLLRISLLDPFFRIMGLILLSMVFG
ncbi:MAG: glycosyl hydrolase [Candidatus Thermoplasmatota archaeon]|nr:glycosyl hydrolase [Candidatus Thermoplasmatota archaeon]